MQLERIQQWVADYGPSAVGVGSTLDNTGVPIFFVIGMGLAYNLASTRYMMLIAALIGSAVGDLGTYAIGRYFLTKERILQGGIGRKFKPLLDAGDKATQRWGSWAIIFGRFIPYVGKIIPFLAGSYKMSWLKTTVSVCVGSLLLMLFFYLFSETAIDAVTGQADIVKYVSLAIGTAVVALLWWTNNVLKRRAQAGSEPPAGEG